ncbi:MAG TPA: hypothetical protein VM687_15685 [Stenotrophomonas sp.]|nr:hypothetical protein [Stenotrophomonas sp.]
MIPAHGRRGLPIHVLMALGCYLSCFWFPAIYVNEDFEAVSPLALLGTGWGGVFDLNFGWFANPAFALAVTMASSRPRRSVVFAAAGLLLALSFPFYSYVRVHELSSQSRVSAYGWGYALWIASMAVLVAGQASQTRGKGGRRAAWAASIAGGCVVLTYAAYLMLGG